MTANATVTASPTPKGMIAAIIFISIVASLFIFWLVYYHHPVDVAGTHLSFLPALNAFLNSLSAVALVIGFYHIRSRHIASHRAAMFTAFIFSTAFLVSYLASYFLHGETHLGIAHSGLLWYSYAIILFATHIPLAIVALPMILITFFFSLTGRFPAHKRIARWTFPIWLYVSVSGVFVYFLQAVYR